MRNDSDEDRKSHLALAHLHSQCKVHGVAAVKVDDGEMFMFSRETIELLKSKMDESGQEMAIIFVKTTNQTIQEN